MARATAFLRSVCRLDGRLIAQGGEHAVHRLARRQGGQVGEQPGQHLQREIVPHALGEVVHVDVDYDDQGHLSVLAIHIQHGSSSSRPIGLADGSKPTAAQFVEAVHTKNVALAKAMRAKDQSLANTRTDFRNQTILAFACRGGNLEVVKLLTRAGADVEAPDENGLPPLYSALPHPDILKHLIAKGATVRRLSKSGESYLNIAAGAIGPGETVDILISRGLDVDHPDSQGATPLMRAGEHMRLEMVQALLKHHASVTARDKNGNTALHHVARPNSYHHSQETCTKHEPIIKLLLKAGADPKTRNQAGQPPYEAALKEYHQEAIKLLAP